MCVRFAIVQYFLTAKNLHIEAYNRGQNQFRHFALNDISHVLPTLCVPRGKKRKPFHTQPL